MVAIDKLLATARSQIGYLEKVSNSQLDDPKANAGYNNWTKYARDLDRLGTYNGAKNGYAWCDVFVDWCFITTFGFENGLAVLNQPTESYGASCYWSALYYKQAGRFYTSNPQLGDQIFFTDSDGDIAHTGIVECVTGERVYTIEGNTSSDAGVVANGGSVNNKSYSRYYGRIAGYGRPNWDLVEDQFKEVAEDYMTREEIFNELGDKYIKTFDELPKWAQPDLRELLDDEVINGGTDYIINPNDINMPLSDIKTVIICKRMIDKMLRK